MKEKEQETELIQRAEFLLEEVGDHKKSYEIAKHLLSNSDTPKTIKNKAQEIIDRIKIDPATWFMVAFVLMGILIEILLTK